jgi:hypothetical protein
VLRPDIIGGIFRKLNVCSRFTVPMRGKNCGVELTLLAIAEAAMMLAR